MQFDMMAQNDERKAKFDMQKNWSKVKITGVKKKINKKGSQTIMNMQLKTFFTHSVKFVTKRRKFDSKKKLQNTIYFIQKAVMIIFAQSS